MEQEKATFLYGDRDGDRYLRVIRIYYRYQTHIKHDIIGEYYDRNDIPMRTQLNSFFQSCTDVVTLMEHPEEHDAVARDLLMDLASAYADVQNKDELIRQLLNDMKESSLLRHTNHHIQDPNYPALTLLDLPLGILSYHPKEGQSSADQNFDFLCQKLSAELPQCVKDHRRPTRRKMKVKRALLSKRLSSAFQVNEPKWVSAFKLLLQFPYGQSLPVSKKLRDYLMDIPENEHFSQLKEQIERHRKILNYSIWKRFFRMLFRALVIFGIGLIESVVLDSFIALILWTLLTIGICVYGIAMLLSKEQIFIDKEQLRKDLSREYADLFLHLSRRIYWADVYLAYCRYNTPKQKLFLFGFPNQLRQYISVNKEQLNTYYRNAVDDLRDEELVPMLECPKYLKSYKRKQKNLFMRLFDRFIELLLQDPSDSDFHMH